MQDGLRTLTSQDIQVVSATRLEQIGAVAMSEDGRIFRYSQAGATSLTAGSIVVAAPLTANSNALVIPAQSALNLAPGSLSFNVTNGATAVTQNQFAEGFVEVLGALGGYAVRIAGNTAAAGAGNIVLTLGEPLTGALVAGTNTVNLTASPYVGVIASTTLSLPVGVVRTALPATYFGWLQTYGHCLIAATGAIVKGAGISQDSATTAGNVATASGVLYQAGIAKEAAANGFVSARIALD
jgi:hypothetical protein